MRMRTNQQKTFYILQEILEILIYKEILKKLVFYTDNFSIKKNE